MSVYLPLPDDFAEAASDDGCDIDDTGGADGDCEIGWSLFMQREIAASVYLPLPSPPTVIVSYGIWRTRKNKCSTLLNIKTVICFQMFTS